MYLLGRYPKLCGQSRRTLCNSYRIFVRYMKNILGVTNFYLKKHSNSNINLLSIMHWEVFLVKKKVLKSFIKMLKITSELKTIFSKTTGSNTATFLKICFLFLCRYFLEFCLKFHGLAKEDKSCYIAFIFALVLLVTNGHIKSTPSIFFWR